MGSRTGTLAILDPLHAGGCAAVEQHAANMSTRDDGEVLPLRDRAQEGRGRAGAPMPSDAELIAADAEGRLAIEIRIARKAKLGAGLDPGGRRRVVVAKVRDLELAQATVILAFAAP